jgi:hypothetical protein
MNEINDEKLIWMTYHFNNNSNNNMINYEELLKRKIKEQWKDNNFIKYVKTLKWVK